MQKKWIRKKAIFLRLFNRFVIGLRTFGYSPFAFFFIEVAICRLFPAKIQPIQENL